MKNNLLIALVLLLALLIGAVTIALYIYYADYQRQSQPQSSEPSQGTQTSDTQPHQSQPPTQGQPQDYEIEIEDFAGNAVQNKYDWGGLIDLKTVEFLPQTILRINVSGINQNKSEYVLYIKHLTFVVPLSIQVKIGNKAYKLKKTTDKLTFSESKIVIPREDLAKSNFSIVIAGDSEPLDFLGNAYYPEVDWIELEAVS